MACISGRCHAPVRTMEADCRGHRTGLSAAWLGSVLQRILACVPQFSNDLGIVSARDINRALAGSFPSAADIEPGWSTLVERGYVRRVKEVTKNPGRPAIRYEINPAVASGEFCQYSQSDLEAGLDNYYIYGSKSNLSLNRIDNIDNIQLGRNSA